MNECPQCETQWATVGRFCPDCLYHLPGPSLRERLRRWLHRAALTAGELAENERIVQGVVDASRSTTPPPAVSADLGGFGAVLDQTELTRLDGSRDLRLVSDCEHVWTMFCQGAGTRPWRVYWRIDICVHCYAKQKVIG